MPPLRLSQLLNPLLADLTFSSLLLSELNIPILSSSQKSLIESLKTYNKQKMAKPRAIWALLKHLYRSTEVPMFPPGLSFFPPKRIFSKTLKLDLEMSTIQQSSLT